MVEWNQQRMKRYLIKAIYTCDREKEISREKCKKEKEIEDEVMLRFWFMILLKFNDLLCKQDNILADKIHWIEW